MCTAKINFRSNCTPRYLKLELCSMLCLALGTPVCPLSVCVHLFLQQVSVWTYVLEDPRLFCNPHVEKVVVQEEPMARPFLMSCLMSFLMSSSVLYSALLLHNQMSIILINYGESLRSFKLFVMVSISKSIQLYLYFYVYPCVTGVSVPIPISISICLSIYICICMSIFCLISIYCYPYADFCLYACAVCEECSAINWCA